MITKVKGTVFDLTDQQTGVYYAVDHGVKADGVTSASSALQALLTAAALAHPLGSEIILPAGTIILSSAISLYSSQTLRGSGVGTNLKLANGSSLSDNLVKLEGISDATVRDLSINGNRANVTGTQYGIYVGGSTGCTVKNCFVYGTTGVGIHNYNSTRSVIAHNKCTDNFFHGMECEQTTDSTVVGNVLYGNLRHGLYVFEGEVGASGTKGLTIVGNVMKGNLQAGCIIQGPLNENIAFIGNTLRENTETGLMIYDRPKGININGNIIALNGHFGLYMFRGIYCTIQGNQFYANSQALSGGYQELMFEGDATQASKWNTVTGNMFRFPAAGAKAQYAIKEASLNDGPNVIANNMIIGTGTAGTIGILHETGLQNSFQMTRNNWGSFRENRGVSTHSGTGAQTSFQFGHGLTPDAPREYTVAIESVDARIPYRTTADGTNITVQFTTAPIAGTGNVVFRWTAKT